MYNKLGTVLAVALAAFPFATLLAHLAQSESSIVVIVVAAILAIFIAVLLIATRVTLEPEAAAPLLQPGPPVAWSWDGVNRQPDADASDEGTEIKAQH